MQSVILGGGCFWCIEAVFERIKGILKTEVGYSGGPLKTDYTKVCAGDGNIEVVKIEFDEKQISLVQILEIFFQIHDPTSLDRQGFDKGIQYRSAIFFENKNQEKIIKEFVKIQQTHFVKPIVTQIYPLQNFHTGEIYHQHYFNKNPDQAYCQTIILPKLQKLNLD